METPRITAAAIGCGCCLLWGALLVACQPSDPTPAGRGGRTFQRTCSGCHGSDARGTMRPGLTRPPRDLTNPAFQAQVSDEQLRQSIRVGKGQMPAFGGLMADEEITELIAFIRRLVPPGSLPSGTSAGAAGAASSAAAAPGAGVTSPGVVSPGVAGAGSGSEPATVTARGASSP